MNDLTIYETGSGGDLAVLNSDLVTTFTVFTQVYLAFFGGNLEAVTKGNEPLGEPRGDWWGNALFLNRPKKQFNSYLERALTDNVYNAAGRVAIENAAKKDLANIKGATVSVQVIAYDRIKIIVSFNAKTQEYVWDNAAQELIVEL